MANLADSYPRPPLVLIVTNQEWVSLSFETLFSPRGYAVIRASHPAHVVSRVKEMPVDLLLIDRELRGTSGVDLCRELNERELLTPATPVVLIAPSPWPREEKLEALHAGAWDVCSVPTDSEELFLRLNRWVRAKVTTDAARERGLLDPDSGLYNAQGLLRRISELGANAIRHGRSLACLVVSAVPEGQRTDDLHVSAPRAESVRQVASALLATGRASDAIGLLTPTEFVIVAPETNATGAMAMAQRLSTTLRSTLGGSAPSLETRFGCYAVSNFNDEPIAPTEVLVRAAEALRDAERLGEGIHFFSPAAEVN